MRTIVYFSFFLWMLTACVSTPEGAEIEQDAVVNSYQLQLTTEQLSANPLDTEPLAQTQLRAQLRANGKTEVPPQGMFSVSVPLGGYLVSTRLLPGSDVKKGEVLAVLEDLQYVELQENYLTVRAECALAKATLERQQTLYAAEANSEKQWQEAKAHYEMCYIRQQALAEKLQMLNLKPATLQPENLSRQIRLYAPFDGFVSRIQVNVGQYVTPADVLFELIDPGNMHLQLRIFEKEIEYLAIGQRVRAYRSNHADTSALLCNIALIGQDVAPDGTVEVLCRFDSRPPTLLPGTYMYASLETQPRTAYTIPEEAVIRYDGQHYLFVAHGQGNFEMRPAEIGTTFGKRVEIKNAAAFSDFQIITKGAYTLLMGLKNKEEE